MSKPVEQEAILAYWPCHVQFEPTVGMRISLIFAYDADAGGYLNDTYVAIPAAAGAHGGERGLRGIYKVQEVISVQHKYPNHHHPTGYHERWNDTDFCKVIVTKIYVRKK